MSVCNIAGGYRNMISTVDWSEAHRVGETEILEDGSGHANLCRFIFLGGDKKLKKR